MTDRSLQTLKWVAITVAKTVSLLFVGWMISLQIPEIFYDLGPKIPIVVSGPEELFPGRFTHPVFAAIKGQGDFEKAFVYKTHGLSYSYFTIKTFGHEKVVVRTSEPVTDQWNEFDRFVGRLRPFRQQPFSYRIKAILKDSFQIDLPDGAYFLALYDKPELNGWQVGAALFASLMWVLMFYMFFIHRSKTANKEPSRPDNLDVAHQIQEHETGSAPKNNGSP